MDSHTESHVLAVNAGSSSIKFALYRGDPTLECVIHGSINGIGGTHACFSVRGEPADAFERRFPIPEHVTAVNVLLEWLGERIQTDSLHAVAYRIVHGGTEYNSTQEISGTMLATLFDAIHGEPEHLPQELRLIDGLRHLFPKATHIACFDSTFHAQMPAVASTLAIPHRFSSAGVRRFGYHGLSCSWMLHELSRVGGPGAADGKLVLAHLGGGASITAVHHGVGRDTTMGLTPAGGIVMGTRSGDIDPGLAWRCTRQEPMSQAKFNHMLNHESGLLGVSGYSADLSVLLAHESQDSRCAAAVELFIYQARKNICAMAGAVDGIDTLIFSGGIGENSAAIRARVCDQLTHLGVVLDPERNEEHCGLISSTTSRVEVRVIQCDEQWMLAEQARQLLASIPSRQTPGAAHA